MSNAAVMKFIALVEVHFPRARFSGDEAKEALWLRSMNDTLSPYDDDVLMAAAVQIRNTRDPDKDGSYFPKPVECIRACDAARESKRLQAMPLLETRETILARADAASRWTAERVALARSLAGAFPDRDRAERDGWADHLFHFCRENARLPDAQEVAEMIAAHAKLQDLFADLETRTDPMNRGLLQLGRNVRRQTREMIEGGQ